MNILFATLHEIKKETNTKLVEIKTRKNNFDISNNNVQILITSTINTLLQNKTKKIYASFTGQHKFKNKLQNFLVNKNSSLFRILTIKTLIYLKRKMISNNKYITSTGGYVLFFLYKDGITNKEYFVCSVFKQNAGLSIDDNLEPQNAIYVDLKKLQQAIIIDLDKFQRVTTNNLDDEYIRFLTQGANYSDYFLEAFGCNNEVKPEKVTNNILNGVYNFFKGQGEKMQSDAVKDLAITAKKRVTNYLRRSDPDSDLGRIKDLINTILIEHIDDIKEIISDTDHFSEELVSYLHNNDKYKVPFYFRTSKSELKKHLSSKIEEQNKRWSLSVEFGIVGISHEINNTNKNVILNPTDRTILIRDIDSKSMNKFIEKIKEYNEDREPN